MFNFILKARQSKSLFLYKKKKRIYFLAREKWLGGGENSKSLFLLNLMVLFSESRSFG